MASSTSNLDLISSSQASKEVTANALFDASSVSTIFGRRASTTAALTWGYYGGVVAISGAPTAVANGTLALTASVVNYIEYNRTTGALVVNTSGWTSLDRVYAVTCGASTITSYVDWRFQGLGAPLGTGAGTVTNVSSVNADVTVATQSTTPVITLVQSPALRSATTTINVASATAPTTGQVLTATSGTAATWQTQAVGGDMVLASVQTVTGAKTFGSAGAVGKLLVAGTTSGAATIAAPAVAASYVVTLPAATDTLVGLATADALTNKTYNGNTFTAGTGILTIAASKTLTASNTLTLAGTDATTMTFPPASASVGYLNIPQNSQSTAYTTVLADSGKHLLHPSADTTARIFTIDSNANVAYPIGTAITFVNQNAGGVVTIAITSDTMRLAGAGTTGSRTLAADGMATALKLTSTEWIISGTGLT